MANFMVITCWSNFRLPCSQMCD